MSKSLEVTRGRKLKSTKFSFLEAQIKKLLQGIQQIKDIDSIKTLRQIARDTIDRISDHKLKEEQKRLGAELATRGLAISPKAAETASQ